MEIAVNYVAVLVAGVAAYAIGALWHSPVGFGKQWMRMMGLTEESMKGMPLTATQAMVIGFFAMLVFAYVLAVIVGVWGATTVAEALMVGFFVWLIASLILLNGWLWEGKSFNFFLFNSAYQLAAIMAMALILALWQ